MLLLYESETTITMTTEEYNCEKLKENEGCHVDGLFVGFEKKIHITILLTQ